ncbi:MAG TPA: hypothetical protein PKX92_05160 [Edaphocola sp.]|nr:hypothetical protein [Edaphocola sp.]
MNDLWLRRNGYLGKNTDSLSVALWEQFNKEVHIQNDDVFSFFKKYDRIFSEDELKDNYINQFLLLAHENDTNRRAYYLQLIQKSVKDGNCEIEREVNFIIRTAQLTTKDYTKNYPILIEELKKKYHLDHFSYQAY